MSQELWTGVDAFFGKNLLGEDAVLEAALAGASAGGLPSIQVSPLQGKFLHLLAAMLQPRAVLEIGTLGGYSTIWLARALAAGGKLTTLELSEVHAKVARENVARAGLQDRVEVIVGKAEESLKQLTGPFDLIFIDADKPSNVAYLTEAMRLARAGTLIVIDNVVFGGKIADAGSSNSGVQATRKVVEMIRDDRRLSATALQTVGSKGYDGLLIIRVQA